MLIASLCAVLTWSDGDSGRLDCDRTRFRLHGIDAGEVAPFSRCRTMPTVWACSDVARAHGPAAVARARHLTRDGSSCRQVDRDRYGRVVVRCTVNGRDLGETLVREGLAIADPRYGAEYRRVEAEARRQGRGVWR